MVGECVVGVGSLFGAVNDGGDKFFDSQGGVLQESLDLGEECLELDLIGTRCKAVECSVEVGQDRDVGVSAGEKNANVGLLLVDN